MACGSCTFTSYCVHYSRVVRRRSIPPSSYFSWGENKKTIFHLFLSLSISSISKLINWTHYTAGIHRVYRPVPGILVYYICTPRHNSRIVAGIVYKVYAATFICKVTSYNVPTAYNLEIVPSIPVIAFRQRIQLSSLTPLL